MRIYRYHVVATTAIALVVLPYVWLTNTTATRLGIIGHTALLWFLLPICISVCEIGLKKIYRGQSLLFHAVGNLFGLLLASVLMIVLFQKVSGAPLKALIVAPLFTALLPVYTGYLFILFARHWRQAKERELKITAEKNKAAWQVLSAQVKPHFLFNTLNTIEYLVDSQPNRAKKCLAHLSSIYRMILENSTLELVPLSQELELVKHYAEIQKERFEDRFGIDFDIQISDMSLKFPPNLLLNCIENAIKHGSEHTTLAIRVREENDTLTCEVQNQYSGDRPVPSTGFGTKDAKERLAILFEQKASFDLMLGETTATARIVIPKVS